MRQKTYVLAKAILERKDVLFGSNENTFKPLMLKEKEDAWEAVRLEMIEQGFPNFERKSWRDVRNHDWQYLRRSAVAKYEHNQKTGVEHIPYSEVDKVVFEIMGNELPSSSTSQFDVINGALALLNNEDQQQQQLPLQQHFQFANDLKGNGGGQVGEDFFADSSLLSIASTMNGKIAGGEVSSATLAADDKSPFFPLNATEQQQQKISAFLNNALAASASILKRKMSWETAGCCSRAESPTLGVSVGPGNNSGEPQPKHLFLQQYQQHSNNGGNEHQQGMLYAATAAERNCRDESHAAAQKSSAAADNSVRQNELFQGIMVVSSMQSPHQPPVANNNSNYHFSSSTTAVAAAERNSNSSINEARPSTCTAGLISSTSAAVAPFGGSSSSRTTRKRAHSFSPMTMGGAEQQPKEMVDLDPIQEAKLQLLQLQMRREEIMLEQEKTKLMQEQAKLRQEEARAELAEYELRRSRRKAI